MDASLSKGDTIPSIRQLAGADGLGVGLGVDWIDSQRHRNHTVAAIHRFKGGGLGTCFCEGDTVPSVRQLAGADGLGVSF